MFTTAKIEKKAISKLLPILTDVDGVLLEWEPAFTKWMNSKGYEVQTEGVYKQAKRFGIEQTLSDTLTNTFNESAWMGYLKAFRDARSGVAKLYEHGYRFHCITSLSLDKKAIRLRKYNLENVFGKGTFKEVLCLDTGADKDEALAPYAGSDAFWIEDKLENAECGAKLGLKSILLKHDHNKDEVLMDGIKMAGNWADIVDMIVNS